VRALLITIAILVGSAIAHADPPQPTVALLPLATGKGFELYGQPVAAEVARALRAGGLEVVVVSAGATPPARAHLAVDGTIAGGAHGAVALQVRVRDLDKGAVVATLDASAPELTELDHAAADLSSRVLAAVKEQLAIRAKASEPPPIVPPPHHDTPPPQLRPAARPPVDLPAAFAWGTGLGPDFTDDTAAGVARALIARTGHRAVDQPGRPDGKPIAADYGLAIEIVKYEVEQDGVWTARASARVRWIDPGGHTLATRIVHTDTVVGSRKDDRAAVARDAAAELADILAPRVLAWARGAR
jgi:hypothetical protein